MHGHKTGVAKRIQDVQPKAYSTHCHGHSLNFSVKDTVKNCKLLLNTMDTAKEVVTLIKLSPKRERLLGGIKENLASDEQPGCNRGCHKPLSYKMDRARKLPFHCII